MYSLEMISQVGLFVAVSAVAAKYAVIINVECYTCMPLTAER